MDVQPKPARAAQAGVHAFVAQTAHQNENFGGFESDDEDV